MLVLVLLPLFVTGFWILVFWVLGAPLPAMIIVAVLAFGISFGMASLARLTGILADLEQTNVFSVDINKQDAIADGLDTGPVRI